MCSHTGSVLQETSNLCFESYLPFVTVVRHSPQFRPARNAILFSLRRKWLSGLPSSFTNIHRLFGAFFFLALSMSTRFVGIGTMRSSCCFGEKPTSLLPRTLEVFFSK